LPEHDRELVQRIIGGDPAAFEGLVLKYMNFIYSILRTGMGMEGDQCDDVFQTILEKLWENDCRRLRLWTGEGALKSYLAVITRRTAIDYLVAAARLRPQSIEGLPREVLEELNAIHNPETVVRRKEIWGRIQEILRELGPRDRELISLRFQEELSYREIADRLGMTVTNVGVSLGRALPRLLEKARERLPDLFDGDG
jgi:RNA polymerase sigma-70 factor (ECF subfamily)